jgi:hypothetical protein
MIKGIKGIVKGIVNMFRGNTGNTADIKEVKAAETVENNLTVYIDSICEIAEQMIQKGMMKEREEIFLKNLNTSYFNVSMTIEQLKMLYSDLLELNNKEAF